MHDAAVSGIRCAREYDAITQGKVGGTAAKSRRQAGPPLPHPGTRCDPPIQQDAFAPS